MSIDEKLIGLTVIAIDILKVENKRNYLYREMWKAFKMKMVQDNKVEVLMEMERIEMEVRRR